MMAKVRVYGGLAAMLAGCAALSGCMSSPTYGTDKTAAEHLVDDLGSTLAFTPDTNKTNTKYQPRAGLVLPPGKEAAELVQPQATLASRDNNPAWVESPKKPASACARKPMPTRAAPPMSRRSPRPMKTAAA